MRRTAAAIALLTLTGCGSGGEAATTTTTAVDASTTSAPATSAAPSTTGDPDDPRAAILEAHKGFWDTWLAANNPPNPDHPGLRKYYTGEAYETAVASIEKNKREGVYLRLPEDSVWHHTPGSLRLSPDHQHAILSDCAIDDGLVIESSSERVVNDAVVTRSYETELVLQSGQWKVVTNRVTSTTDGVAACTD